MIIPRLFVSLLIMGLAVSSAIAAEQVTAPEKPAVEEKAPAQPAAQAPDPLDPYMKDMRSRVQKKWGLHRSPTESAFIIQYRFTIDKAGKVENLELVSSNATPEDEKAARQSILDSAPFGELPPVVEEATLPVDYYFYSGEYVGDDFVEKSKNSLITNTTPDAADARKVQPKQPAPEKTESK